jgi:periplasmic protein TonB
MFDLISERAERPFRQPAAAPRILSIALHVAVVTLVVIIPLLTATDMLPKAPSIIAFVADTPAPPPPPAPPAAKPATPEPTRPASAPAAPIEAPSEITPPAAVIASAAATVEGRAEVGVQGGESGGVAGGIVGGVVEAPPPAPQAPVRIGGRITAPALLHRVEPAYSTVASSAHLTGMVILEAVVDTTGCVQSVKVVRSAHPVLDGAAIDALKQWRYKPLVLNGDPASFVLTVTVNFSAGH